MGIKKLNVEISIIIPCFNSGEFIKEAIQSCSDSTFSNFEIIIVNDGSTDSKTIEILEGLDLPHVFVFSQINQGPSSARNLGVAHSRGDFLLFLDSDNRIRPTYLSMALDAMKLNNQTGVVYSKPHFFGLSQGEDSRFRVKPYSFDALLVGNYIDMCSLVRKEAFTKAGSFDESRELFYGEDADLWVRIHQAGWGFHFIDEILFEYRIREDSLMGQVNDLKRAQTLAYFGKKHGFLIHQRYRQYFRVVENFQKRPFTYFLRILYYKYILRRSLLE